MDLQAVYRKSEKGAEAIATRGHGVGGKLRTLLILVDGKKTGADLVQLAAGMGESVQLVEELLKETLIEPTGAKGAAGASVLVAAPAGAAAAALAPAAGLDKLKLLATRLLVEQLGPSADGLALKIEVAKDIPQFVEAMKRAYAAVRDAKGQAAADRFGGAVEAEMPGA